MDRLKRLQTFPACSSGPTRECNFALAVVCAYGNRILVGLDLVTPMLYGERLERERQRPLSTHHTSTPS